MSDIVQAPPPAEAIDDTSVAGHLHPVRVHRGWRDRPLWQLTSVRFKEFLREPEAIFWSFGFPILLAVGLGIAFRNRPAEVMQVGVIGGGTSAPVTAALRADKRLAVQPMSADSAHAALRSGRIALVVVSDAPGHVTYEYDDTRPDARVARLMVDDAVQRGAGRPDPVGLSESHVHETGSRYIDFVIPGLLGMNIMGGGIWGLGFAIVDARRRNLLKRLVATPMSRAEYLLSFLFSRLVWLVVEVVLLLGFAVLFFGVPTRGSLPQLAMVLLVSAFAFGGLGLLIASRARTMEGVSGLMNLSMLPMWVLSGVFFSSENFPRVVQPFIQALPLTAANNALRANMLRGEGWGVVGPELTILAVWMVVTFALALRMFRWR